MTRPTSEQIKALRKGDVVTVRAVVYCGQDSEGDVHLDVPWSSGQKWRVCALPSEIVSIQSRAMQVGDRVAYGAKTGELKGVCDDWAWVRLDSLRDQPINPIMFSTPTENLRLIP